MTAGGKWVDLKEIFELYNFLSKLMISKKKIYISHLSNLCFKILTLIFFYFPFNVTSYMEFYPEHVWQIFYGINLQISHFFAYVII